MHSIESRGSDLRAFDAFASELSDHCEARFEAGGRVAGRDIQRLGALAERLGRQVVSWGEALRELEVAAAQPLNAHRTARLLIETVFDEALIPEATRVLAAALALVCPAP
jgi:hypothetical protein